MLSLALNFPGNHVLFGRIVDRLVQVLSRLVDVVDPRRAQRLEEREYFLAVLDALRRVNERNLSPVRVV